MMRGVIMMAVKTPPSLLLLLLTLLTGVCPQRLSQIYVKAGEMVALRCPHLRGYHRGDAKLIWTSHTTDDMDLTNSMSSVQQRPRDVLVHGRNLVILRASVNHQGNYSCSLGNVSRPFWFRLMVYPTQTREYDVRRTYSMTCHAQESCTLKCPDVNNPAVNTLNIISNGTIWHKDSESSPKSGYISNVEERDQGVYTCTRSYLYQNQIYYMTFTVVLGVQPKRNLKKSSVITSPRINDVYCVELGSTVVIDCKAALYSDLDEVFWLSGETFVDLNDSLPVFYNYTLEADSERTMMTASLVIKKVTEDDLLKRYICKLETSSDPSSFVTITLAQKAVEEAVLDCTEQSQTVVLVPTSSVHCPGSGPLSAIHAALVDRQTRLVFIQTETAEGPKSGSVPEALQLLAEAGDCVTWKGTSSTSPSSSFYYLPAPQRASENKPLASASYPG